MGGSKPQRLLGGVSLLDRAIASARAWSDAIAVAIRGPEQRVPPGTAVIEDVLGVGGPLGGLIAALRFASEVSADAALVIPADMPFLPGDLSERLEAALARSEAAIASSGGHSHPVCGLWRIECAARVPDYLATGRRSLRGFAAAVGAVSVEWDAFPRDPFFNVNSPDDLAAAERKLST